jgi:hypothetical protein
MNSRLNSRSVSLTFLILSCLICWSATSLAQNLQAGPIDQSAQTNRVTLTQQAPPPIPPAVVPRHDSFCSEEAWNNYFNSSSEGTQQPSTSENLASNAGQPSASRLDVDEIPYTGIDPLSRMEQIPDERVEPMSRVQEIPDERVQALPRIGE